MVQLFQCIMVTYFWENVVLGLIVFLSSIEGVNVLGERIKYESNLVQ